ncbi:hypothetical protein BH10PLA2_BH10PLA2_25900 [soil metagenome]
MTSTLMPKIVRLLFLVPILGIAACLVSVLRHDDKNIADVLTVYLVVPGYLIWLFKRDFWRPHLTRASFQGPLICLACLSVLFYFGLWTRAFRASATRMSIANDLTQIGHALSAYKHKHGSLPPAYTQSPDGKPLLSWRVLLLPYLEQEALFKQFHLDEPWDSPNNLPLAQAVPRIYCNGGLMVPSPGVSYYRIFGGPDSLMAPGKSSNIKRDADNLPTRCLVFEASEPVPWTKPETTPFMESSTDPRFGATRVSEWPLHWTEWRSNIFACVVADGSVRFLPTDIGETELSKIMGLPVESNLK